MDEFEDIPSLGTVTDTPVGSEDTTLKTRVVADEPEKETGTIPWMNGTMRVGGRWQNELESGTLWGGLADVVPRLAAAERIPEPPKQTTAKTGGNLGSISAFRAEKGSYDKEYKELAQMLLNNQLDFEGYDQQFNQKLKAEANMYARYGMEFDPSSRYKRTGLIDPNDPFASQQDKEDSKSILRTQATQDFEREEKTKELLEQAGNGQIPPEQAFTAIESMEDKHAAQCLKMSALNGQRGGLVSLSGFKPYQTGEAAKFARNESIASSYSFMLHDWMKDKDTWDKHKALLDAMGDHLANLAKNPNGTSSGIADADKQRMQFMCATPEEQDLAKQEVEAYYKALNAAVAVANQQPLDSQTQAAVKSLHDAATAGHNAVEDKNSNGERLATGLIGLLTTVKTVGTLQGQRGGAVEAINAINAQHKAYWEGIMRAGAQNPRYLKYLIDQVYDTAKEYLNAKGKNSYASPYQHVDLADLSIADDKMKDWESNEWFKVPDFPQITAQYRIKGSTVPKTPDETPAADQPVRRPHKFVMPNGGSN